MNWLSAVLGLVAVGAIAVAMTQLRIRAMREQRLACAVHELRNPLHTALLVAGQVGRVGQANRGGDPARDRIAVHLRRCALALEQFEGGRRGDRLREQSFDVAEVVAGVVAAWPQQGGLLLVAGDRSTCAGAALGDAATAEPMQVWGDSRLLEQSLANLIANALEHGEGEVTVSTTRHGSRAQVLVRDQGPGLHPRRLGGIRALGGLRKGTRGHGLAIAAAAAGMLGGRLTTVDRSPGAGVAIDLPLAVEINVRPRGAEAALAGSNGC